MISTALPRDGVDRRTRNRRLLKLADLLAANARNKRGAMFDLCYWGADNRDTPCDVTPAAMALDCDSVVCAIGLACLSGVFKRGGLNYRLVSRAAGGGNNLVPIYAPDGLDQPTSWQTGFIGVARFFGLDLDQTSYLFSARRYPDGPTEGAAAERRVAQRIRQFVAGKVEQVAR